MRRPAVPPPSPSVLGRCRRQTLAVLALLLGVLGAAAPAATAAPATLKVGTVTLRPCAGDEGAWCGSIRRALDPWRPSGPRIPIAFRWRPADRGAKGPTLVAMEGGPGYPSTGSAAEYTGMYGPLLRDRDLLLVDMRGTGGSSLIDCRALQDATGRQSGAAFARGVGRCGRALNRRWRDDRGWPVHASELFSTANATDDLDAVLRALRRRSVDLYGDSYGTFFVQSFVSRHRDRLHSVVLDSAYPVRDLDPFYASSGRVGREAIDLVCARDPACAAQAPGRASDRLAALVAQVRRAPLTGRTRAADGTTVRLRVGPRELADLVQDSGSDALILRELDAAVRAALAGDPGPLLRLSAQARAYDHGAVPADYFSFGLYWATACTDYPQLFSPTAAPARRRAQLAAAALAGPQGAFAPFTLREWLTISGYSQPYDGCLSWPRPTRSSPVLPTRDVPLPASVPLLVLGGDLDSLTPVSDAREFAGRIAARSRVVPVQNAVHVPSQGSDVVPSAAACARRLVRAFVRDPDALERLDARCAERTSPVHTPGAFPRRLADAAPAAVVTGTASDAVRRAATVGVQAVGDATVRYRYSEGARRSPGLRGGVVRAAGEALVRFDLERVRFVADARVSGHATWRPATGEVRARLTVRADDGTTLGRFVATWNVARPTATAVAGAARLTLPAP